MPAGVAGSVAELGEDALVRLFGGGLIPRSSGVVVGPGDDAAVVRAGRGPALVLTTDLMAEGVHFRRGWSSPAAIGRRLAAVNVSDLAAMGAAPAWALLAMALPPSTPASFARGLRRGLARAAGRWGFTLAGGDTCASRSGITLALFLAGTAGPRTLRRSGGRPGDLLWVTGHLGASALGLAALKRFGASDLPRPVASAVRRHLRPEPRLDFALALARSGLATAAIDVSDGLARDLGRLCEASGTSAAVDAARLPVSPGCRSAARHLGIDARHCALHGGEEYELLFATRPRSEARVARLALRLALDVTCIGALRHRRAGLSVVTSGRSAPLVPRSWEHFGRP